VNLSAQIGLITVPQEFTRLCNAILTAEHGDDYRPIDDDRADRGNDGYLKSERRLFAAHCFKRVQNQSIDEAILRKMVGDLGKAIALKREGIWDIGAWTFLCNYKIIEAVAARLTAIGREADVEVSWRGPEELAAGLQKHVYLLEQFPELQGTRLGAQLDEIQDALASLEAVTDDGTPAATPLTRSPRTAEEQRQLLVVRQPGWEYLLFAGVLAQGMRRLEPKERDHELQLARGPRQHLDLQETTKYLSRAFGDLAAVWEPMGRLFQPSAQEQAFGAPGEPGDAARIEHFARRIVDMYEQTLDWGLTMRSLDIADPLKKSVELAARAADQPASDTKRFIEHAIKETDRIPAAIAGPDPTPVNIELSLVLTVDERLMAEFNRELKRATDALADGD
jgi:hypothetical protein